MTRKSLITRNSKLFAYTLFALIFPFWILFGRITEKDNQAFKIDSASLAQAGKIINDMRISDSAGSNRLENALINLAEQNGRTSKEVEKLTETMSRNRDEESSGRLNVKISPSSLNVNLRTPDNGPTPGPYYPNLDSAQEVVDRLQEEVLTVRRNISQDIDLRNVFNINPEDDFFLQQLDLKNLCCENEKQYLVSIQTKLQRMETYFLDRVGKAFNVRNNYIELQNSIRTTIDSLKSISSTINDRCERKIIFGIKNTYSRTLKLQNVPIVFKKIGKNAIIQNYLERKDDTLMNPNEILYFEVKDPCEKIYSPNLYTFSFVYERKRGFVKELFSSPINRTTYLSIQLRR